MHSSSSNTREFPALLMTALIVGASLGATGALRKMTEQARPSAIQRADKIQDFAPSPEFKLTRLTVTAQLLKTSH